MRIIAGKHKGRKIELPKEAGDIIRPTSDFAREAIFNILIHGKFGNHGESFIDKNVLDMFCGTGAFGLEALSRGARHVTFVDQAREAIATARYNVDKMKETDFADFIHADATKLGKARKTYSLIFLDPPYFGKLIPPALSALQSGGWIAEDGLIITEHDAKEVVETPPAYTKLDERRYGRAVITLLKLA